MYTQTDTVVTSRRSCANQLPSIGRVHTAGLMTSLSTGHSKCRVLIGSHSVTSAEASHADPLRCRCHQSVEDQVVHIDAPSVLNKASGASFGTKQQRVTTGSDG